MSGGLLKRINTKVTGFRIHTQAYPVQQKCGIFKFQLEVVQKMPKSSETPRMETSSAQVVSLSQWLQDLPLHLGSAAAAERLFQVDVRERMKGGGGRVFNIITVVEVLSGAVLAGYLSPWGLSVAGGDSGGDSAARHLQEQVVRVALSLLCVVIRSRKWAARGSRPPFVIGTSVLHVVLGMSDGWCDV